MVRSSPVAMQSMLSLLATRRPRLTLTPLMGPAAIRGLRRHPEGVPHGEEAATHARAGHLLAPRGRGQARKGHGRLEKENARPERLSAEAELDQTILRETA